VGPPGKSRSRIGIAAEAAPAGLVVAAASVMAVGSRLKPLLHAMAGGRLL